MHLFIMFISYTELTFKIARYYPLSVLPVLTFKDTCRYTFQVELVLLSKKAADNNRFKIFIRIFPFYKILTLQPVIYIRSRFGHPYQTAKPFH